MSDSPEPQDTPAGPPPEREVLSSLPRRRPQRLTARREATRSKQAKAPAKSTPAKRAKPARSRPARTGAAPMRAPKQGFASDEPASDGGFAPGKVLYPALRVLGGATANGLLTGAKLLGGAVSRLQRR
ncbi:MAG TPA: hypothetical protein VIC05_04645 [Solirubrobacteraceae bacterium]|jgi:hypothetical protein